jgi:hypothetical protein
LFTPSFAMASRFWRLTVRTSRSSARDFSDRAAVDKLPDHLRFARRQTRSARVLRTLRACRGQFRQDRRAHVAQAAARAEHRAREFADGLALADERGHARVHHRPQDGNVRNARQNDDAALGPVAAQAPHEMQAVFRLAHFAGHGEIGQHDVARHPFECAQKRARAGRFANDLYVSCSFERRANAQQNEGMIVGKDDS